MFEIQHTLPNMKTLIRDYEKINQLKIREHREVKVVRSVVALVRMWAILTLVLT